ncbi:gluconate 2-dehydrogenase subunit 3 family protein [Oleiharenicola lentus]|uniref:gluconate 2-dehydrogenase subunit 3 family protein n=1 Tax=Oleiharenicola lentus TaxID=2508720 RepID=UPI003F66ED70
MTPLRRIDRRTALKWMLTAAASAALAPQLLRGAKSAPRTIGTDPDLHAISKPGELWPLTLTEEQRLTAAALCDTIIPADERSSSASALGVVDFIDEWISAPYPAHVEDRELVLTMLGWVETEASKRFSKKFPELTEEQKHALCDDVCFARTAKPELKQIARAFAQYRDLTAGGFYTTPQGRDDVGYVGNVPLATFDGPPPEVLRKAGLIS